MSDFQRGIVYELLHNTLVNAQVHRAERTEFKDGRFEWNTYEMEELLQFVNVLRHALRKPPVTFSDIEKIESRAGGHVDYTHQLALYATDLVIGV